ncbi:MAG: Wzz/FepE/Etk N-terminal domain-containing protein [Gammaproteobacteria bacterium]|nr:Wzz/FepE/Etk N-terminal domain-containing protein [Gammaproteobacteria bacterium]MCF6230098.1 Wzz/FepE/Etk N-terminal domain-containing protein [Gammaproteobacteria bacterium]
MTKKAFKADSQCGEPCLVPQGYYSEAEDEIDLLEYWDLLWSNRWLIVLITTSFTTLAIVIALLTTPIYKAEVLLAPAGAEEGGGISLGGLGGLASLVGVSGSLGGGAEEGLAVLKSRLFLNDFFVKESLLPVLFAEQWQESEPELRPTLWDAYALFTKQVLSTSTSKENGMIQLSISWKDPVIAASWANKLVVVLNEHMRRHAIEEATQSIDYLNQQISQTSVLEMQQMLYGLIEDETKKTMLANVRVEYAFKVIDPAVVPEKKIKPKRALIVILGMVLGLFFAVFFVFFRTFIRKAKQERSSKSESTSLQN